MARAGPEISNTSATAAITALNIRAETAGTETMCGQMLAKVITVIESRGAGKVDSKNKRFLI